jgi:hypothetical protein
MDKTFCGKGSFGIEVNEDIGHYFKPRRVCHKVIHNMLAILIARAKEDVQVKSLITHLVDGGVSIIQNANDIVIFM